MFSILVVIFLILSTGFFALSELSLIASKKQRLHTMAEEGNKKAALALELAHKPNRIIASSQIGLTIVTLIEGAVTRTVLDPYIIPFLHQVPVLSNLASVISLVVSFTLVTFLTILLGDILPKRIAIIYPEQVAVLLVPITSKIIKLFNPLIIIFSFMSDQILNFLRMPIDYKHHVSADDITDMFEAGAKSGLLDQTEKNLLDNVWRMDERKVGALMTPRSDIIFINTLSPARDNLEIVLTHPSKRIIVCNGDLDNILGYGTASVWLKDSLKKLYNGENLDISWLDNIRPVHSIPNTLTLIETLESFRKFKTHVALVYNEFGHVEGLITMFDLMAAVIGEYPETTDDNLLIHKDPAGKWLIDGLAPLDDVKDALGLNELPGEDLGNYHTAAGFALSMLGRAKGRLPKEFDQFEYEGYVFEVVDIDRTKGYRIGQLMVKPMENILVAT